MSGPQVDIKNTSSYTILDNLSVELVDMLTEIGYYDNKVRILSEKKYPGIYDKVNELLKNWALAKQQDGEIPHTIGGVPVIPELARAEWSREHGLPLPTISIMLPSTGSTIPAHKVAITPGKKGQKTYQGGKWYTYCSCRSFSGGNTTAKSDSDGRYIGDLESLHGAYICKHMDYDDSTGWQKERGADTKKGQGVPHILLLGLKFLLDKIGVDKRGNLTDGQIYSDSIYREEIEMESGPEIISKIEFREPVFYNRDQVGIQTTYSVTSDNGVITRKDIIYDYHDNPDIIIKSLQGFDEQGRLDGIKIREVFYNDNDRPSFCINAFLDSSGRKLEYAVLYGKEKDGYVHKLDAMARFEIAVSEGERDVLL